MRRMIHARMFWSLGILLGAGISGCTVGPNYHRPDMPAPPAYKEPQDTPNAVKAAAIGQAKWWQVFQDPVLNQMEEQAVQANLDIRIAVAHVDQSDAARRSVKSYQLPTISAD